MLFPADVADVRGVVNFKSSAQPDNLFLLFILLILKSIFMGYKFALALFKDKL
jgi:hypothetical protein